MRYVERMNDNNLFSQIQAKASDLDKQIEAHHAEIKKLESDRNELTATLTVLRKHNFVPAPVARQRFRIPVEPQLPAMKMTAPDMILTVLERYFPNGSEPASVLAKIKERFDPDVDPNNIRPTMWRMEKDGRLQKIGDKYRLPQKNEAAGSPSEIAPTASVADQHAASGGVPVLY